LPPRDLLYARCDRRFSAMLELGALDEVRALISRELDPDLPVMRAIGVPEISTHLSGTMPLDETISRGQQATRNYAKRQYTWFRRQLPPDWQRIESLDVAIEVHFERLLQE
jgi:tRNA dimethylallyltransferase